MSKPRILLINPPGKRFYARDKYCTSVSKASYYWPQIDLLVLSGRLKDRFDVALVDAVATGLTDSQVVGTFAPLNLAAMIFLTSAASFPEDMTFVAAMKKASPQTRTIGIGGILLGRGKEILAENGFIDAALLDFTSPHVLDYLHDLCPALDMLCRDKDAVVQGERTREPEFGYPAPLHDQLPAGRYRYPSIATSRFTVAITSVGCRFGCRFCVAAMASFKKRSLDNVMEEMETIRRQGFEHVLFHDFTFVHDPQYADAFCDRMIGQKIGLEWTCQTRVDGLDATLLAHMKRAGCRTIQFGVESGDDEILRQMNKETTVAQVRRAFSDAHRIGLRTTGFFMLGWPGESSDSLEKTIDLAVDLDCDYASFTLPMPHAGTWLGDRMGRRALPYDDVGGENPGRASIIQKAYRRFYLRPAYWLKRLLATRNRYELLMQVRIFISLITGLLKRAG